jgi:predicted GNAT family acetyltransferase
MRDTSAMTNEATPARAVTRHDDRGRYELVIGGEVVAFADFSQTDDVITIPYIETEVRHRGNGYSGLLMDGVIDDLRDRGERVRATCSVARAHLIERATELLVA